MTVSDATDRTDLVDRWFGELFSEGDLDVADEILAPEITYRGPGSLSPTGVSDPADVKEYVAVYRTAFPDLRYTVEDVTEAGDRVVAEWSAVGTQENPIFGADATGESFVVEGVSVFVTEDGVVTEVHSQWDTLAMVQQLGTVPSDLGF